MRTAHTCAVLHTPCVALHTPCCTTIHIISCARPAPPLCFATGEAGRDDKAKLAASATRVMLILRLLKRSLSQQHRQHGTRDRRVVSRHASSLKTTPSAGDRAREEKKENERWAKQPGAREVLAQPPFNEDREQGAEADMCRSLEDYLKVCGFVSSYGCSRLDH